MKFLLQIIGLIALFTESLYVTRFHSLFYFQGFNCKQIYRLPRSAYVIVQ